MDRVRGLYNRVTGGARVKVPEEVAPQRASNIHEFMPYTSMPSKYDGNIYKAVIPQWFYKPPWGLPLTKDVVEIRRISQTPYVSIVRNTITHEIAGLDWKIEVEEGANVPPDVIAKTKKFFYNPNRNDENLGYILKQLVSDSIEIDGAVLEKVHNFKGDLVEIYARDAGLFTKNPDIHGVMPEQQAYWQYSWTVGTPPIPFNHRDLVYMVRNPRTDTVYGRGEVENLWTVLRMLMYGAENNLEYFTEGQTAKGIIKLSGAKPEELERFKQQLVEANRKADTGGFWRAAWHKIAIVNTDVDFVKTGFSNIELDLLEQQKWFSKVVWACFGCSPAELGFTEDVNRATALAESATFQRKVLRPFMMMIEYSFDTQVVNALPWIKGKYEDMVHFKFERNDLASDKAKREIVWGDYDRGLITLNQALGEIGYPTLDNGDLRKGEGSSVIQPGSFGGNSAPILEDTLSTLGLDDATLQQKVDVPLIGERIGMDTKMFNFMNANSQQKREIIMLAQEMFGKTYSSLTEGEQADVLRVYMQGRDDLKSGFYLSCAIDTKALDTTTPMNPKQFEEIAEYAVDIDDDLDKILAEVEKEDFIVDTKALPNVHALADKIASMVNFSGFAQRLNTLIGKGYNQGLEHAEVKTKRNFLPDEKTVTFLKKYSATTVTGLSNEMKADLRKALTTAYKSGYFSKTTLTPVIKDVLDVSRSRAKMIAVTEMNRAVNAGKLQGFVDSEIKGKVVWKTEPDVKEGHSCYELKGMERNPGKLFRTKGFTGHGPPAHPNCRCTLTFVPAEE